MDWKSRVRMAFLPSAHLPDDDVLEELADHAAAAYDAAREGGLSHDEADARVADLLQRWRLDAASLYRPSPRPPAVSPPPAVAPSPLSGLLQDVRYATRLLVRQPRYTLLASLTMALGIGATTTLFGVTHAVLMKPLPWPHADRLVVLEETRGGARPRFGAFTNAAYLAWRESASTIDGIEAWSQRNVTLTGTGDAERIRIAAVSPGLFALLGARPLAGSFFDPAGGVANDEGTIVLSESLWRQRFGGGPDALGTLVRLDGEAHRVVGVLPDAMAFPDREARAWVPFRVVPATGNYLSTFNAIARLSLGATAAQAGAEGTARGRFAADTGLTTTAIFGRDGPIGVTARPLTEALTAEVRRPLLILLAAVGLLLVTATANVASLQLARATTRVRELAIRAALGAGGVRVMRQLLVESLLVGLVGGGAGLALAWLLHRALPSLLPADFPRIADLGVDAIVILFALGLALATSGIAAALPVLRIRRLDLVDSLTQEGTNAVGGRLRIARARLAIMIGQIAIACALLVGASLLARSFIALVSADRGYDPSGVLTARISLPASLYTPERRYLLLDRVLTRLAGVPHLAEAAFTSDMPLTPGGSSAAFTLRSPTLDSAVVQVQASPRVVSPRAFAALGMRLVAGRRFSESDSDASAPVAIVNRAFARRYLGNAAVGARLPMGVGYQDVGTDATVVGVLDDVRYLTAADASQPEIYYSYRQLKGRLAVPVVTLLVRTPGDPRALVPSVRAVLREADPDLAPDAVATLEDRMLTTLARPRLYAVLLGGFAVVALAVAGVGLFGVLSYTVAQRSRELAVRAALGARGIDLARLVLGQGLGVTAVGLALGFSGSLALTRSIGALLYGIAPYDAATYCLVAAIFVAVALIACLGPARRAARLDPVRLLRL